MKMRGSDFGTKIVICIEINNMKSGTTTKAKREAWDIYFVLAICSGDQVCNNFSSIYLITSLSQNIPLWQNERLNKYFFCAV